MRTTIASLLRRLADRIEPAPAMPELAPRLDAIEAEVKAMRSEIGRIADAVIPLADLQGPSEFSL